MGIHLYNRRSGYFIKHSVTYVIAEVPSQKLSISNSAKNYNFFLRFDSPSGSRPPHDSLLAITDWTHLIGILWTSDRPVRVTSTCQHRFLIRDIYPCLRRSSNPAIPVSERAPEPASDRAATGVGKIIIIGIKLCSVVSLAYLRNDFLLHYEQKRISHHTENTFRCQYRNQSLNTV